MAGLFCILVVIMFGDAVHDGSLSSMAPSLPTRRTESMCVIKECNDSRSCEVELRRAERRV